MLILEVSPYWPTVCFRALAFSYECVFRDKLKERNFIFQRGVVVFGVAQCILGSILIPEF